MSPGLVLYVALGGAAGSALRYVLTYFIQSRQVSVFPTATLLINVEGSILLGLIMRVSADSAAMNAEVRLLLTTGFCGGFTTFSTFSYETARLYQDGDYQRAALYAVLSLALCIVGVFVGFALGRVLFALRRGAL